MRRTLLAFALVLSAAVPAAAFPGNVSNGPVAAGDPNAGRCSPLTDSSFTGTLQGADGLGVNATIGFDIQDVAGNPVDLATGCAPTGYGAIVQLNHDISGQGAPLGTLMTNAAGASDGVVTNTFALNNLPANAKTVWIEVYTRAFTGSKCGWSCAGTVDVSKYGFLNRRAVPIVDNHVDLSVPLTPAYGGSTGSLSLTAPGATISKVYAWSMLTPDGSRPDQGWGIGVAQPDGSYTVPSLGSGQTYVAWVYTSRGLFKMMQIPVAAGATTGETIDVNGPASVDLTRLPTHKLAVTRQGRQGFSATWKTKGDKATFTGKLRPTVKPGTPVKLLVLRSGRWVTLASAKVDAHHGYTVAGILPFQGSASWRLQIAAKRDTLHIVAT